MDRQQSEKQDVNAKDEISSLGILWRCAYLIGLQMILLKDFWMNVLRSGPARSWDGSTHYATASIINRTIYPDTFGWTNAFMGGVPLPNYYSPLLFWLTALLTHLGIKFDVAFKIVALAPTLLIVPCLWLLAYKLFGKRVAFWTAFVALLQITIPQLNASLQWPSGLDYVSTFVIGYYAQSLGFVLLIFWYLVYVGNQWSPGRHLAAGIMLGLAVLSSYLAVIASAVVILSTLAFDAVVAFPFKRATTSGFDQPEREATGKAFFHHFLNPALSVGLSAFWTIPVLATYSFVVTRPFHGVFVTAPLIVAQCLAVLGGVLAWKNAGRAVQPFIVVCVGLTLLSLCAAITPGWFPLQENRLAAGARFLATVLIGISLSRGVEHLKRLWKRFIPTFLPTSVTERMAVIVPPLRVAASLLLIAMLAQSPGMKLYARSSLYAGFYPGNEPQQSAGSSGAQMQGNKRPPGRDAIDFGAHEAERSLQGILQFARAHTDGRYLVAIPNGSQLTIPSFDAMAMSVYLGAQGNEAVYAAYREASVSSLFLFPQLDAFSTSSEAALRFGISSTLGDDLDFREQPLSVHLARVRWLGIRYLVVYDDELKKQLKAQPDVEEAEKLGSWSIFALEGPVPSFAEALRYRPALVVSDFSAKLRRSDEHSFLRLAEEQFADNWFDVPLVRSSVTEIDHLSRDTLDQFGALIVETYDSDDFFQAYDRLKWFSRTRPLILLPRDERLFFRISNTASEFPHAVILGVDSEGPGVPLENLYGPTHHYTHSAIREEWRQIRHVLEENKVPVASKVEAAAIRVERDHKSELALSMPSLSHQQSVPVLLRMTYHPRWKMSDSSQVYAATPFFSLVFARSQTQLKFGRDAVDKAGLGLSALFLIALLCLPGLAVLQRTLNRRKNTRSSQVAVGAEAR